MNYELNDYLIKLHQHIINEQSQIRTLVKMIASEMPQELPSSKVMSLSEVRANVEKRQKSVRFSEVPEQNWLVVGEKESRFSIFLKLNQQLQKWIELEISLLKDISKIQNSPTNDEIGGELQPDDLSVLHNYYNRNLVVD